MSSAYYIPSNPIPYHILCQLSSKTVGNLKIGLNFLSFPASDSPRTTALLRLLVYQNVDRSLIISRNLCRHAGGYFVHDIEDLPEIVRCTYHGWKLNTKTLEYIKPITSLKQKQLTTHPAENGDLIVLEPLLYEPWTIDPRDKQTLEADELIIVYHNHSCVEIKANEMRLIIDPWLTGPCYDRSWWLLHEINDDCLSRVASADGIFLTQSSPDHFHLPTLRLIAEINPKIPIYLPEYLIHSMKNPIEQLGFAHISTVSFGNWQELQTKDHRVMILPDHKHPHIDCVLLFEYKGYKILNLVDCLAPNGDYLPYSIDVLLSNFTANKNAFPSCFTDQFSEEKVLEMAKLKDENYIKRITKFIQLANPTLWIPIGGYFIEAGPNDEQIRRLNWKNHPSTVAQTLQSRFPLLKTWCPFPQGKYDLGTKIADQPSRPLADYLKTSWNFKPYIEHLEQSMQFEPLQSMQGVQTYFQWSLFNTYDLILHIVETTNDFREIIREYSIDFLGSHPTFSDHISNDRPTLRIRIRASVLRHLFLRGLPWIHMLNGFSARYSAQPNIYHRKFWSHFKYHLPLDPPQWNHFHAQTSSDILATLDNQ